MSFITQRKWNKKDFLFIIGLIIAIFGMFTIYWTYTNIQCGPTVFSPTLSGPKTITVCVVGPTIQDHRLYGGTDPYLYYIYGLIIIIAGLLLIYFGIDEKQQKPLETKLGGS